MNTKDGGSTIGDALVPQLMKEREDLLKRIDWDRWDAEQSRRLTLLDTLLGI
jgi:hypothetical protein